MTWRVSHDNICCFIYQSFLISFNAVTHGNWVLVTIENIPDGVSKHLINQSNESTKAYGANNSFSDQYHEHILFRGPKAFRFDTQRCSIQLFHYLREACRVVLQMLRLLRGCYLFPPRCLISAVYLRLSDFSVWPSPSVLLAGSV